MLQPFLYADRIEAGIDEAGRGCYAGPVFAAAVILPAGFQHPLLNDSKQLKKEQRELLRPLIEAQSISWAVAMVDNDEIDCINILQATYAAMHRCIELLRVSPDHLLIDGNRFKPYKKFTYDCIIKGDGTYASIAAASILAKTHRDAYMQELHHEFPHYDWINNKGYGTASHRAAIDEHGLCKYHRKSFSILPSQISLFC
ncbi:MAG: ribonuclease HII [Ferruginibacter sp.]